MSVVTEGFHGQLDVAKRKREIIPALLVNAPYTEDELHIPLQLRFDERLPLVISFYEYYRFLDRLVGTVLQEDIARLILVRVKMPAVIPLPRSLLDARVAIFYDIDAESGELSARGTEHLCVDANFKLYPWSAGDNRSSRRYAVSIALASSTTMWRCRSKRPHAPENEKLTSRPRSAATPPCTSPLVAAPLPPNTCLRPSARPHSNETHIPAAASSANAAATEFALMDASPDAVVHRCSHTGSVPECPPRGDVACCKYGSVSGGPAPPG